ncbi:putative methyltransferase PMT27 [Hibiscus syriacus]|uniref:Methyltransferase n=1 Tax=Hibiscus syriacus TaxID=106335 RepID=A0A6A2ZZJ1_HIBSY|nr:putative methyltransferase PMT27 [Hibiscus syriacus]
MLLLELNRVLRPGGYFVWSVTPVYQNLPEDVKIWKGNTQFKVQTWFKVVMELICEVCFAAMSTLTKSICRSNPPMCDENDDANAVWHVPLQACMHHVPVNQAERGARWPANWPNRLQKAPYWLNRSQMGIHGKPAPQDFAKDYEHWTRVVSKLYMSGLGISWFAAALKDIKVWVMNVVNFDAPDTLPIIYERGLFGIYHDWCKLQPVMAEVDRIVRPGGKLIVRVKYILISNCHSNFVTVSCLLSMDHGSGKESCSSFWCEVVAPVILVFAAMGCYLDKAGSKHVTTID